MAFENYLVASVNQIDALLVKSDSRPEERQGLLLEAAVVGCRTLKQLCRDPELDSTVDQFADVRLITTFMQKASSRKQREHRKRVQAFRSIIENSEHFEEFLNLEREVLIRAGLSANVVDLLIEANHKAVEEVKARAKPPSEVIEAVRLLRDRACVLSDDLVNEAIEEIRWSGIKGKIKQMMLGLGGAALIGLNASALAASVGITVAGSTVSIALGGAVVSGAAGDLVKVRRVGKG